ncbi:hypothetical protein PVAP13_4NG211831 [Panicum virgatum]|uniref:Uncharacterized protein n=1 Tax=Panicum virgatum TaxID=38727 RepID=A0A8T0T4Q6_PANVG|nr:hypothetical protein PVAP13_4NG211831 [Panicum virgatum]
MGVASSSLVGSVSDWLESTCHFQISIHGSCEAGREDPLPLPAALTLHGKV